MDIGKSLKMAMLKNNMTRDEVAEKMGFHLSNVSRIVTTGVITTETLGRLAAVFNMQASDFIKLGED